MSVNDLSQTLKDHIAEATTAIKDAIGSRKPEIGIILGSGLGDLADRIENAVYINYGNIPHMKCSTATSHVGRFVVGDLNGKEVICMQGRLHGYEGYTSQEVAFPVWVMHEIGINTLIVSNAAGAINPSYHVGDLCIMTDHINFTGRNPVEGSEPNDVAFRFFSMFNAYDPHLRRIARETAIELQIPVQEGIYIGVLGPSFETPAEIRAFGRWGADTVAMSVVEEVIAARHVGVKVLGISLCSNMACGIENSDPADDDVLAVAKTRSADFCKLITSVVGQI